MNLPEFLRDDDGLIRIVGHRVSLDDIVWYYREGYSPEMLLQQFPTLALATIHKTIAFYLENETEVDAYVAAGESIDEAREKNTQRGPSLDELRARALARGIRIKT